MLVDFQINGEQGLEEKADGWLVYQLRRGDPEVLSELYRRHHPAVYRFALYLTADPAAAADVTQDVFIWFMDHAERFDPQRGNLAAFLGGIARKFAGRWRAHNGRFEFLRPGFEPAARGDEEPSESRIPQLLSAVAALPMRYREAVALCDLQGKSYEEAAMILECPVGTVRSRLHRARELLARKMEEGTLCASRHATKSGND